MSSKRRPEIFLLALLLWRSLDTLKELKLGGAVEAKARLNRFKIHERWGSATC